MKPTVIGLVAVGLLSIAPQALASIVAVDAGAFAGGTDVSDAAPGVTLSEYSIDHQNADGSAPPATSSPIYSAVDPGCVTATPVPCSAVTGTKVFATTPTITMPLLGATPFQGGANGAISLADYVSALYKHTPYDSGTFHVFRADFANPTSYVSLVGTFLAYDFSDGSQVLAFDSAGDLVASCFQQFGSGQPFGAFPNIGQSQACDTGWTQGTGTSTFLGVNPNGGTDWTTYYALNLVTATPDISFILYSTASDGAVGATRLVYDQVPEPATLSLFGIGLTGLGFARQRKRPATP